MAAFVVVATPITAEAADQTGSAVPISELETLAQTLENDAERKKFIATLKGLIATQKTGARALGGRYLAIFWRLAIVLLVLWGFLKMCPIWSPGQNAGQRMGPNAIACSGLSGTFW